VIESTALDVPPPAAAIADTLAPLDSIVVTEKLLGRAPRPRDHETENCALTALVQALADSPRSILQTLADKVLAVLQAHSAGLSLVTKDETRFYWAAIAGAWRPHVGGGTPRHSSPCGDVLQRNAPILFSHWERRYPYLSAAVPLAEEGLLVPFHVHGKAVGTIWAIAHDARRRFDAEDLRLLESMGRFASAAYQAVESIDRLESEAAAREHAEMGLHELTRGLAAQVHARTQELRRSETFLAEAQRLSRIGSFSWRVATDEITWSAELYRIFALDPGIPPTPAMIRARVHPDDVASLQDTLARARVAAMDLQSEARLRMPDGSVKYLHLTARGSRNAHGSLEYIGVVQDMTERRVSEEALAGARSELARAARLATVAELSAAIAHEVNQPLGAVAANGAACHRWLSSDPPNLERAKLSAERMVRDATCACAVVNRVRALFKHSAPDSIPMNLNESIEAARQLMLDEAAGHGVSIETHLERDLPLIGGDRLQIQQVMVNLIRNGVEAMQDTAEAPKLLSIRSKREGSGRVRVEVRDRGAGLQNPDMAFRPFFTTKKTGMGMGLAVSRSIIEAHQGRLWVTRNEERGATFSFTLPALAAAPQ